MHASDREKSICDAHPSIVTSCSLWTQELMLSLTSLQNSLYYSCFFRAILQPHSSPQQPRLLPKFSHQSLLHPKEFCVHLSKCWRLGHRPRALHPCTIFWSDFSLRKSFLLGNKKGTKLVSFPIPLPETISWGEEEEELFFSSFAPFGHPAPQQWLRQLGNSQSLSIIW